LTVKPFNGSNQILVVVPKILILLAYLFFTEFDPQANKTIAIETFCFIAGMLYLVDEYLFDFEMPNRSHCN